MTTTVTVTVTVTVVYVSGMLLSSSDDDRYLMDAAHNPVLLVGDSAWCILTQLNPADVDTYLADCVTRGFNTIMVMLINHNYTANAPNNYNDDAPFTGANFTTPNEAYFAYVDQVFDKALNSGVYILLAPLYLGYVGTEQGWDTEVDAASAANIQTWGEYVGNRYGDYDNLAGYIIVGDRDPTSPIDFTTKLNSLMTGIQTYDTRHLVTIHNNRNTEAFAYLSPAWLTLNNIYTGQENTPVLADDAYTRSPTIPFFQIEAYYELGGYNPTTQELRSQAYWTVLGGGSGHIYGNEDIYDFDNWSAALDDPGRVSMTHFSSLFNAIAWHTLVPDTLHSLITVGYGTINTDDFAGAAIDAGGTLAAIYMPSNRTMTVAMSLFAGTVTARWYDPTSGQYENDAASPLSNSGTHNFSHAGTNDAGDADWILLLEV